MVTTSLTINKKEHRTLQEIAEELGMTRHGLIKALMRKAIRLYEEGRIEELKTMLELE